MCEGILENGALVFLSHDQTNKHPRQAFFTAEPGFDAFDMMGEVFNGIGARSSIPAAVQAGKCQNSLGQQPYAGLVAASQFAVGQEVIGAGTFAAHGDGTFYSGSGFVNISASGGDIIISDALTIGGLATLDNVNIGSGATIADSEYMASVAVHIGSTGDPGDNNLLVDGNISGDGSDIGWVVYSRANTACTTTCGTRAAVMGFATLTPVNVTDETADICLCTGD